MLHIPVLCDQRAPEVDGVSDQNSTPSAQGVEAEQYYAKSDFEYHINWKENGANSKSAGIAEFQPNL